MDIDSTFKPIGVELIDSVFPTDIVYRRHGTPTYDPATGEVTEGIDLFPVKAGVLFSSRTEDGGAAETRDLTVWIHHDNSGLPFLPTTGDHIDYADTLWKVVEIGPTYQSKGLIASKIVARNQ